MLLKRYFSMDIIKTISFNIKSKKIKILNKENFQIDPVRSKFDSKCGSKNLIFKITPKNLKGLFLSLTSTLTVGLCEDHRPYNRFL